MKNLAKVIGGFLVVFFLIMVVGWLINPKVEWAGVDESVVHKFAEEAGRPASDPLINTDQGDLLLFAFLVAGIIGGFVMGYNFRQLFPPRTGEPEKSLNG
ncbi:hypothetical protein ACFL2Q_13070 [Thermodesulfobacteriota bacterium]